MTEDTNSRGGQTERFVVERREEGRVRIVECCISSVCLDLGRV